jgi:DNA-binding NarL/FixJ family response regulator
VSDPIAVVLVDDDDDLRGVIRGMIAAADDIELVGDVGQGVEGIEETIYAEPDVIVLDYMMPGMSGDIVAAAVKENSPRTKILVFTAVLEAAPEWADAFLTKLQIGDLIDQIRSLAADSDTGRESAPVPEP